MKKYIVAIISSAYLSLLSTSVFAGQIVPEMDGSSAMIALGLAVGVVALLREHQKRK